MEIYRILQDSAIVCSYARIDDEQLILGINYATRIMYNHPIIADNTRRIANLRKEINARLGRGYRDHTSGVMNY